MEEKVTMDDLLIVQRQVRDVTLLVDKLLDLIEALHPEITPCKEEE